MSKFCIPERSGVRNNQVITGINIKTISHGLVIGIFIKYFNIVFGFGGQLDHGAGVGFLGCQ